MSNSIDWIQLLLFLVIVLAINVLALREGFEVLTNPFSQYIQSLITIDPDHEFNHQGQLTHYHNDSSGNCSAPETSQQPQLPNPTPNPTPNPIPPSQPPSQPSASSCSQPFDESSLKTLYDKMKVDINHAIKNELMNEHKLNKPIVTNSSSTSFGTAQGKEMLDKNQKDCPQNAQPIDMSEYIRKDSIPCWGCSV
jgi:hypothetical protein